MFGAKAATPEGTARAEAPGLSEAREKAGAVPAESVCRSGEQRLRSRLKNKVSKILLIFSRLFIFEVSCFVPASILF
ncbi:hypothetical protein AMD00_05775 [Viridibacillus arvi]|uniref:Uncharacterized protein n=1 Tax=Viridibacillus arvi TaxID=263475 RepID=A0A0M0LLQ9_9BACL|nr:hypothetical protein AMD00_05775 [Viridibacillus arvi]